MALALWISVTLDVVHDSGGTEDVSNLEYIVARNRCVEGSFLGKPYIRPSGPGADVGFLFASSVLMCLGNIGARLKDLWSGSLVSMRGNQLSFVVSMMEVRPYFSG